MFLCCSLLLGGCSETGPEQYLDDYLVRLERVLEQGYHDVVEETWPRLPPVRDLELEPPQNNIDILAYLRLGRCELQHLVAERNSNLGRLAQPSQRLVYEVEFLRAGAECLDAIEQDHPQLAADLARILARKQQNLPVVIWEATLGGDEFRSFWQAPATSLPLRFEEDAALQIALSALIDDVQRWLSGDYVIDSTRLEAQLDAIRRGSGGAQLKAWALLEDRLDEADHIVRDRLARRPFCFEGMQTADSRALDNVVRKAFVGRVQVWAAGLNDRYYELFPRIRALEAALADVQPPAYQSWRIEREAFLEEATSALADHVGTLQPLLEQCDLLPGANVAEAGRIRPI